MPIETPLWRASIGIYNRHIFTTKSPPKTPPKWINMLANMMLKIVSNLNESFSHAIVYTCLFLILLIHISIAFFSVSKKTCKPNKQQRCLIPLYKILLLPLELVILNATFSLINRSLLIRSGSVEKNPGLLSFATWNIDSLIARNG